ncbi:MAG: acetyltransferase [Thiohalocapsa sp.]|nr:acetyltransferase [Thiohalocapsa sp.]
MAIFDVFNGDADGICALQQLRLSEPADTVLVTGVKRDISLLKRVDAAAGDHVNALDISLDKNREPLLELLERGVSVRYFDHHYPGEIPEHPQFDVHIETLPDKGTSLLVDDFLDGAQRLWAVVGTYGDNFDDSARRAAEPLQLSDDVLAQLRELGILINYNGYGAAVADLHVPPDELFRRISPYADPMDFIRGDDTFKLLRDGYTEDMTNARAARPELETERHSVVILPAEKWARRVSGVYANDLAQAAPGRAHAMLTRLDDGGFVVSVRAPLERPEGADALCRQFATGGGRKAAAGINNLPDAELDNFVKAFSEAF